MEFTAALAFFVGTHFLPNRWHLRDRLIATLSRRVYFSIYGIVSLLVLIWLIGAAGRAPHVPLWGQAEWYRWVPVLTMPVALLLAVLGAGIAYPHTLGGRLSIPFDPERPGSAAFTRHPLLWSLALWSLAHLVANGDMAHVILFGGFALLSVGAIGVFDRRARQAVSPEEWDVIRRRTSLISLRPLANGVWLHRNRTVLLRAVTIAAGLYLLILGLHEPVIGVSPLPR